MKFLSLTVTVVSVMLGVPSVASQESASLVGTDQKHFKGADFLRQAAQVVIKSPNETMSKETASNETASNETASDEAGCNCVKGDGQFCGRDDQCHPYSCQAWYEFGPVQFTGVQHIDGSSSNGLTCKDIDLTEPYKPNSILDRSDVYVPSVSFQCTKTSTPIGFGFNKRCSAKTGPHGVSDFTCYELAAHTDFQPFLAKVTPTNLRCGNGTNTTDEDAMFTYEITVRSEISTDGRIDFSEGFDATKVFNKTLALTGTMYAFHEKLTEAPTPVPTSVPMRKPTPPAAAAAPNQIGSPAFLAVIFLIASLVHL